MKPQPSLLSTVYSQTSSIHDNTTTSLFHQFAIIQNSFFSSEKIAKTALIRMKLLKIETILNS